MTFEHTLTVTPVYGALLTLLFLALSLQVILLRRSLRIGIGDGGNRDMARAIRIQANFAEYVPLALIMLCMLELGGAAGWLLHVLGSLLLAGRFAHAWGLRQSIGTTPGRLGGVAATYLVMLLSALLLLYGAVT